MIIFKQPRDISSFLLSKRNAGITIGFVPTMGALHHGHIALVTQARSETQLVACSIFVNPTQFNDPTDFEKYPSSIEKDICLLKNAQCDVLFLPSLTDIYPGGVKSTRHFELGFLETILEGKYRPGHFQGVCQVVHRLLEIVSTHKLYLGQKDFQQCMVIKKLVELMGINVQIIICPTQREPDGLAMSSRNLRLSEKERKKAPGLFKALLSVKKDIQTGNIGWLKERAEHYLINEGFKVEYVEIAMMDTLELVQHWDGKRKIITLTAAYLDGVRLIDNLMLNDEE